MAYYEFKKHVDGIPNFITNGGAFYNPTDYTYITYIPDNNPFWIPDTLIMLTKAQVEQRAKDINRTTPFTMIDVNNGNTRRDMTEAEVAAWVLAWIETTGETI